MYFFASSDQIDLAKNREKLLDQEERLERRRKANAHKEEELKKREEDLEAVRCCVVCLGCSRYCAVLGADAVVAKLNGYVSSLLWSWVGGGGGGYRSDRVRGVGVEPSQHLTIQYCVVSSHPIRK